MMKKVSSVARRAVRVAATRLVTVSLMATALATAGCDQPPEPSTGRVSSQDVKQDAQRTADTAATFAQQEKEDFINASRQQLDEVKQDLTGLKRQAKEAKGDTKAKVNDQVDALERKWKLAELRMEELQQAGGDSWKDLKQGMSDALAELRESYEQAKQDLQRG
jgi:exonuclease VII large subunit